MSKTEQLADVDVEELPEELREEVHDRVAATVETVDDVLADLDSEDLPEADR